MKVSILIPCYNAAKHLGEAIESAINQTWENKEVLIINDGSTDNSLEIIKSFGNKVEWRSRANKGGNPTRNELLQWASGEWIQYLDADDYLMPNKLQHDLGLVSKRNGDVDCLFGPILMDETINATAKKYVAVVNYPNDPLVSLFCWDMPQTNSMLFKKDALLKVGGWNDAKKVCQEHELYFRLLKSGAKFLAHENVGSGYRIHSAETVCRKDPSNTYFHRIEIMKNIISYAKKEGLLKGKRKKVMGNQMWQMCRDLYKFNKQWAVELSEFTKATFGNAIYNAILPNKFVLAQNMFGFINAEKIAGIIR